MQYEVTVKLKHRLNKSKEEWSSQSTTGFPTLEKANTWKKEQELKYKNYQGKVEITDNYSENLPI